MLIQLFCPVYLFNFFLRFYVSNLFNSDCLLKDYECSFKFLTKGFM